MGQDKAQIVVHGTPLWMRQLDTLHQTEPNEMLISAAEEGVFRDAPCPVILDAEPGQGPLGGIATILERMKNEWLLVLAVDLPRMTSGFLRALLRTVEETGRGSVCVQADGKLEPLVAVYPRAAVATAQQQLRKEQRKLVPFIERLEADELITRHLVTPGDARLFENWNTPADVDLAGDAEASR